MGMRIANLWNGEWWVAERSAAVVVTLALALAHSTDCGCCGPDCTCDRGSNASVSPRFLQRRVHNIRKCTYSRSEYIPDSAKYYVPRVKPCGYSSHAGHSTDSLTPEKRASVGWKWNDDWECIQLLASFAGNSQTNNSFKPNPCA